MEVGPEFRQVRAALLIPGPVGAWAQDQARGTRKPFKTKSFTSVHSASISLIHLAVESPRSPVGQIPVCLKGRKPFFVKSGQQIF